MIHTLGWTLIHSLWQGLLIASLLFMVKLFTQRANTRYIMSCIALLLMLLAPIVTFNLLTPAPPDLPVSERAVSEPAALPSSPQTNNIQQSPSPTPALPLLLIPRTPITFDFPKYIHHWLPALVIAWITGVVILTLRLLLQWLYAERLKRKFTRPISQELQALLPGLMLKLNMSRPVQLLESARVDVPTVIGFFKPVILLPVSTLMGLSMQQLEAILAHELAHIRRHDYLVNLFQSIIETLLFYNPAVCWVSHKIRTEREHCCDDIAVSVNGNAVSYAKTLAQLERLRQEPGLAMSAKGGHLLGRIQRIVKRNRSTPTLSWLTGVVLLSLILTISGILTHEVKAQSDKPTTSLWVTLPMMFDYKPDVEVTPSEGKTMIIETRQGDFKQRLTITKHDDDLTYSYSENDQDLPFNPEAVAWYENIQKSIVTVIENREAYGIHFNFHPDYQNSTMIFLYPELDPLFPFPSGSVMFDSRTVEESAQSTLYPIVISVTQHVLAHSIAPEGKVAAALQEIMRRFDLDRPQLESILASIQEVKSEFLKIPLLEKYLEKVRGMNIQELDDIATRMLSDIGSN